MGRLDNQVAIITGGASGIGEGTVRRFAGEGARVVIADVQQERGEQLAEELGPNTAFCKTDVTQEAQIAESVDLAMSRWGRLDVMFNNAGMGGVSGPIDELDMAAYHQTVGVLLDGVVMGAKHAARAMKPAGRGVIINTASVAGLQAGFGQGREVQRGLALVAAQAPVVLAAVGPAHDAVRGDEGLGRALRRLRTGRGARLAPAATPLHRRVVGIAVDVVRRAAVGRR